MEGEFEGSLKTAAPVDGVDPILYGLCLFLLSLSLLTAMAEISG